MISKERDKALRKIVQQRYRAMKPHAEAHKLATLVNEGKATNKQKARLDALYAKISKQKPKVAGVFLSSEEEFERVRAHMFRLALDVAVASLRQRAGKQARGAEARNRIRESDMRELDERLIRHYAEIHVSNSELPKSKKIGMALKKEREECAKSKRMRGKNRTSPTSFYAAVNRLPGYLDECISIENNARVGSWGLAR